MTSLLIEQSKQDIIQKYNSGLTLNKLAMEYGVNSGLLWYKMTGWGALSEERKSKNYGILSKYLLEITNMLNDGYSYYKVAKVLKIQSSNIKAFCKKHNLKSIHKSKVDNYNLVKDKTQKILELYDSGLRVCEISKQIGCADGSVRSILLKHNRELRDNAVYSVDEHFFDVIDTEEKAYILGWLYSDGCVDLRGKTRISLQEEDGYVLEWIKTQLQYTGPLYYKKARNKSKPQVELSINRKVLTDQLIAKGCVPNKSAILQAPSYDVMQQRFYAAFVRGVFEGDGNIHKKSGSVSICGSYDFTHQLVEKLPCEVTNVYKRYKKRADKASSWQLFIGKRPECKKFLDWIYPASPCFCLRRKQALMVYNKI